MTNLPDQYTAAHQRGDSDVLPMLSSIRNRAMLVGVSFSKPKLSAKDLRAADKVVAEYHTSPNAVEVRKPLYPKELMAPIIAVENECRTYLRSKSSGTVIDGLFLVPTQNMMDVLPTMSEFIDVKRKQAVTVFAQNWANVLAAAQQSQGALYDPTQYPDVADVVGQFSGKLHVLPVGDMAGGLFDDVEAELREQVTEHVTASTKRVMASAVAEPLQRLIEAVANMYDKTSRPDSRVHGEALVSAVRDIADSMPALNVLGLKQLDTLAAHCSKVFDVPAEALQRKDSAVREQTAKHAAEVLSAVGVNPDSVSSDQQSRRDLAQQAASDILAQMDGLF